MLTLDLFVNGLIIGVFYALMAIGLSLIFGILKVVNFAHGEFYMVGAYAYTLDRAHARRLAVARAAVRLPGRRRWSASWSSGC